MSQRKLRKIKKEAQLLKEPEKTQSLTQEKLSFIGIIKENWMFLVAISIGILMLYANSYNAAFVSDDYATILNNPEIATWKYALQGASTYFVNALTAMIFGVSPLPFHIFSTVFYIVTCWLGFILIRHLFGRNLARFTLLIFAVHPIHVEAVTWISGRPYLFIAFYVLLSFLFFIKFVEDEKLKYLIFSMMSFVLGFMTDKPRPFSLFLILIIFVIWKKFNFRKNKYFKYWPVSIILFIVVLLLSWSQINSRISVVNSGYNSSESIFYSPFFQYPTGISKYLQILTVPLDLTLYHTMYTFPIWLNWFILVLFIANVIYFYFKDKRIFFALSFMLAAVLPSITPVKVSWLVAERYMFLGSLGFCLFLGIIFEEMWKRNKYIPAILFSLLMVFFGVRTFMRNDDWNTNHKLWVNTCQVSPNSHNAWNNIGDDYDKLNDPTNAVKGFTQSTIVKPNYADAYHNRANILFKTGRLDLARESYNTALSFSPNLYQTYLSLTQIDLMENKGDLAMQHSQAAMKLQPDNPQAAYVVGVVYAQVGKIKEAEQMFRAILQTYPNYTLASEALKKIELEKK